MQVSHAWNYCVIISPVILHTRHVNYFLHSSHKSHVKYSFGQNRMKLLFSLLIWFFTNACLDYLNYIYESTCKSYSEYENNFRKKKKKTRLKFFICQISLNIALDGELFNHGAHIPGNGDFLSERQAGCVRTVWISWFPQNRPRITNNWPES